VAWLAEHDSSAAPLLWLSTAYFDDSGVDAEALAAEPVTRIPGASTDAAAMAPALVQNMSFPALEWRFDPARGWINHGDYSQRNPESRLSILTSADFAFISRFFAR